MPTGLIWFGCADLNDKIYVFGGALAGWSSGTEKVYVYDPSLDPLVSVGEEDEESAVMPSEFELYQNYPNPFNPVTKINFDIPNVETGHAPSLRVRLRIFDILGNLVRTLTDESLPPGRYKVEFDAGGLSSGVYFYRLNAGDFTETKKMILLR
jgi:hypothetical protein